MSEAIVVITSTAQADEATILANRLVDDRFAACVQIIAGVKSTYRWQDKVEAATESLLLIKTTRDAYPMVEQAIKEMHWQNGWYETPEILAVPVEIGSAEYLSWLAGAVSTSPRQT